MTQRNAETYRAVLSGVGWIDRSDRVRLAVTGPDRARFLHNLTTNEVKRLAVGQGNEAFVTSLQGKTLALVSLLVLDAEILVRTEPESLPAVLAHFAKYGALDDVDCEDRTSATFEYHVAGPGSDELLARLGGAGVGEAPYSHSLLEYGGLSACVVREAPTGLPGWTLIGGREHAGSVAEALRAAGDPLGLVAIDAGTFEALRIEAGTPLSGRDVTPDNLPQEVGRDDRAINFVKGCYLGQETVARLDALGHVNKLLKGAWGESTETPLPPTGTPLLSGGKVVGTVTSAAFSPGRDRPVLLAYVRVAQAQAGNRLDFEHDGHPGHVIVTDLPMPRPG